jgi:hypothetical protein
MASDEDMTLMYGELPEVTIGFVPTGFPHTKDQLEAYRRLSPHLNVFKRILNPLTNVAGGFRSPIAGLLLCDIAAVGRSPFGLRMRNDALASLQLL